MPSHLGFSTLSKSKRKINDITMLSEFFKNNSGHNQGTDSSYNEKKHRKKTK